MQVVNAAIERHLVVDQELRQRRDAAIVKREPKEKWRCESRQSMVGRTTRLHLEPMVQGPDLGDNGVALLGALCLVLRGDGERLEGLLFLLGDLERRLSIVVQAPVLPLCTFVGARASEKDARTNSGHVILTNSQ